ncbi:MAG: hypothetical protein JNK87_24505 [Bryobacterales bacterium]|nr:hypothetical protein [Bryobacterales bacterium]
MKRTWLAMLLLTTAVFGQEGVATTGKLSVRQAGTKEKGRERNFYITAQGAHVLPVVKDGAGWSTRFYLTNLENRDVRMFCEHVAKDGAAMVLETNIGRGDGAQIDLLRYGTFTFATTGTGSTLTEGWTYCYADLDADRIGGHIVVRQEGVDGQPAREFTIPMLPDYAPKFVVPFPDRTAFRSELLLVNTAIETPSTIQVRLFTRNEISIDPITLQPGEQRVIDLTEQFNLVNFTAASLVVEVAEGTKFVTGTLLRRSDTGGPVVFLPLAEYIE